MTQGGANTSFNQFSERDVGDYIDLSLEICIILSWMVISTAVLHI